MPPGLKKNFILIIIFSVLLYLGISLYSNFGEVIRVSSELPWFIIPAALFLSLANYLFRFLKWHYYLRLLKFPLPLQESYFVFMSALSLSVTPGKVGELLKSYLIKDRYSIPVAESAPIVLAERITDFFSLLLIGGAGAYLYGYGGTIVAGVLVFFGALTGVLAFPGFVFTVAHWIKDLPVIGKISETLIALAGNASILVKPFPLISMTVLSLLAWAFECLSYYLILVNFSTGFTFFWSAYAYALATIIGAISVFPGGLGFTEGTLYYLVMNNGGTKEIAASSTFLIRMATLWFAVLVGTLHLSEYKRKYGVNNNL